MLDENGLSEVTIRLGHDAKIRLIALLALATLTIILNHITFLYKTRYNFL